MKLTERTMTNLWAAAELVGEALNWLTRPLAWLASGSSPDTWPPAAGLDRLEAPTTVAQLPPGRFGFVDAGAVSWRMTRWSRVEQTAEIHPGMRPGSNHPVGRRADGSLLIGR